MRLTVACSAAAAAAGLSLLAALSVSARRRRRRRASEPLGRPEPGHAPGTGEVRIVAMPPTLFEQWLPLWRAYVDFYKAQVSEETTALTWKRIFEASSPVHCLAALGADGALIGFSTYILTPTTWEDKDACYLEDLFVAPEARGKGVARKLIGHLKAKAQAKGWQRLFWVTNETNYRARSVYDQVAKRNDFIQYRVDLT